MPINLTGVDNLEKRLLGHNALIYGASGGIGRAMAHALVAEGATPILLGRNYKKLEALSTPLGLKSDRILVSQNLAEDEARLSEALTQLGPLSIVVHAAGAPLFKPLSQITLGQWDEVMQVHLRDAYNLYQLAWPLKSPFQQFVFFGSASRLKPWPKNALYGAAKAGLHYFSQALQEEIRPQGGRVWLFEPGSVDTDFFAQSKSHLPKEKRISPQDLSQWVTSHLCLPENLYCPPIAILSD